MTAAMKEGLATSCASLRESKYSTHYDSVVISSSVNIAGIGTSPAPPAQATPIGQT